MPTIFEKDGYRVMLHLRGEHPPAHVHVIHGSTVIVIEIEGGVTRFREPSRRARRPPDREIARALQIVAERIGDCIDAWNRYHGEPS